MKIAGRAALAGGVIFLLLAGFSDNRADYDTFIYLNFGREFWKGRGFLFHDVFSYLPAKDVWVFHEWLSGVAFYAVYDSFGPNGLQAWKMLTGLLTAGLAFFGAVRRGGGRAASMIVVLGAGCLVYSSFGTIRAQVFSFLFLVLTLIVLEEVRKSGRLGAGLALVPLFGLWASLHGGFPVGFGAAGLYGAAALVRKKPVRPFLIILATGFIATLANPYGLALWTNVLLHAASPDARIMEWYSIPQSLALGVNLWGVWAYIVAGAFAAVLFASRLRRDTAPVLVLSALYVMGVLHVRHMALFALALAVYGGAALSDLWGSASFKKRLMPVFLGAAYLPFAFIIYFQHGFGLTHPGLYGSPLKLALVPCSEPVSPDETGSCYPTGFVEYALEAGLSGKIAADYPWGAFLGFMLGDRILTGLDGRCETVFPQDARDSAFRFSEGGGGWRQFLTDHPPDMVLARKGSPVHFNMEREPGWKTGWQDGGTVLFVPDR